MFLHRVKMNWKRYQKLTMAILLFALARIVLETCFGEAPLGAFAVLKLALILLAATVAWAFLKTGELPHTDETKVEGIELEAPTQEPAR